MIQASRRTNFNIFAIEKYADVTWNNKLMHAKTQEFEHFDTRPMKDVMRCALYSDNQNEESYKSMYAVPATSTKLLFL